MKIIITGATKGIGKGIAITRAKYGHSLGRLTRTVNLLMDLQHTIPIESGTICHVKACDLKRSRDTKSAADDLIERLQGIDVLINNAGIII